MNFEDRIEQQTRITQQLATELSSLMNEISQGQANGTWPSKLTKQRLTAVEKVSLLAWRGVIDQIKTIRRKFRIEERKARKAERERLEKLLDHPAPACPYCDAAQANMRALIEHLRSRHGWNTYARNGLCACGIGCSFGYGIGADGKLAEHLIKVGDLALHVAKANLKQSAKDAAG